MKTTIYSNGSKCTDCHNSAQNDGQLSFSGSNNSIYNELVNEVGPSGKKRVSTSSPGSSLILTKPGLQVSHGGGFYAEWDKTGGGNFAYAKVLQWIQEGALQFPPTPPNAPSNVVANAVSSSRVDLSWKDNANDEDSFRIQRKVGNGSWSTLATVGAKAGSGGTVSFSDNSVSPNTQYQYRVRAQNSVGNSSYVSSNAATTPGVPPTAPSNVVANAVSSSQVDLSWKDNASNEDSFRIQRKIGNGNWSTLATVGAKAGSGGTVNFSDNSVSPSTQYRYRVRSQNSVGNSSNISSNVVTTPGVPPSPPDNVQATAVSSSRVDLSWTDNSGNETSFKIQRKIVGGNWSTLTTVGASSGSGGTVAHTDNTVSPGVEYKYQVRAQNSAGISSYVASNRVTTPGIPDITVIPGTNNYGDVIVGSSASQTFAVSNSGSGDLHVSSATIVGGDSGAFSLTSGGGAFTLTPGQTQNVTVSFNPGSTGAKSATLRFASDDPDENPFDVALSGNGVAAPVPDIDVTPVSHNYGDVQVGSNGSKIFVVSNTGNAALAVSSVSLVGGDFGEFSVTSGGGAFTLTPGQTQNVTVNFSPASTGARNTTLRFASDDPDENPFDVALSGNGTDPVSGVDNTRVGRVPESFALFQNYPNPFNPTTRITYTLKEKNLTTLVIYNAIGEEIRTLVHAEQAPGFYEVVWFGQSDSGRTMTSGIFYYKLTSGAVAFTRRMILLK